MNKFNKKNIEKLLFKRDEDGLGYHETIRGVYICIRLNELHNNYSLNLRYGSSKIEYNNMKWVDNIWEILYIILKDVNRNIDTYSLIINNYSILKDEKGKEFFTKKEGNINITIHKTLMSYNVDFIWGKRKLSMLNVSNMDTINKIINFIKNE